MNDFSDIEDDFFTGKEHTPLREDAFLLSPNQKIEKIEALFLLLKININIGRCS